MLLPASPLYLSLAFDPSLSLRQGQAANKPRLQRDRETWQETLRSRLAGSPLLSPHSGDGVRWGGQGSECTCFLSSSSSSSSFPPLLASIRSGPAAQCSSRPRLRLDWKKKKKEKTNSAPGIARRGKYSGQRRGIRNGTRALENGHRCMRASTRGQEAGPTAFIPPAASRESGGEGPRHTPVST